MTHGINTRLHDGEEGSIIIERFQDCTPIAEFAKTAQAEGRHGGTEMRHAGKIPYAIIEKYCNDRGITFQQWMSNPEHARAMLNDPSLSAFRIWPGRV